MNMGFQEPGFCSSARGLELAILSLTFQVPLTHYRLSICITDFFIIIGSVLQIDNVRSLILVTLCNNANSLSF